MTWRQLRVYVAHLPLDCALLAGEGGWTYSDHRLADVVDLLNGANWQRGNAGAKSPTPRPKPIERPGQSKTELIAARVAAFRERQKQREASNGE